MEQEHKANLDVLILCGGLGTRLKKSGHNGPKPMVEINGRPFLDILIEYISSFGFRRFILCAGFKSEIIENYFCKKNDENTYVISSENKPLGTAGGIKNAEAHILSSSFIVLNGDSFCQSNLKEFAEFHYSSNASASITITTVDDVNEYGSVIVNEKQEIAGFKEKTNQISGRGLVNAGIYIFRKKILNIFSPERKISLENEILPSLVGQGLFGFITKQKLFDIGTPERLELLRHHFKLLDK
jgi:D-glycero-alpha-D-manno-heptose 1-phosphate guanylyltransferase